MSLLIISDTLQFRFICLCELNVQYKSSYFVHSCPHRSNMIKYFSSALIKANKKECVTLLSLRSCQIKCYLLRKHLLQSRGGVKMVTKLGNSISEEPDLKKRRAAATDLCCLVLLLLLFLSSKSTDAQEEAKRNNSDCLLEVDYHVMSHFHSFSFCQTLLKKKN